MTLDWNWFFSTLSQSTAAIVGIVGAFIIAKIFSNQSVFSEKNNKMNALIIESKKILDKIETINFSWYNKHTNEAAYRRAAASIDLLKDEDKSSYSDTTLLEIYKEAQFSEFSEQEPIISNLREELGAHCEYLKEKRQREEKKRQDEERRARGEYGGLSGLSALSSLLSDYTGFHGSTSTLNYPAFDATPWVPLEKERQLITDCHLEAKHHARLVSSFVETVKGNPESPPQITWSLIFVIFIFLAGVIYPLTFMPSGTPPVHAESLKALLQSFWSIKGALLTLLTTAFVLITGMFIHANYKMKYNEANVRKLTHLSNVNNYCPYFQYLD
ncbi:hypothetical protein [Pseudomonas putida]|uniref:hypothetical protein n=1 Tax=Pseudomonas putida TaxID=303 RepID=UPI0037C8688B